ncbi:EKC/KEOPS complex subunit LAGE3 isoform X2 [Cavia porcellus]|nr:EKC/KEOPS complex subunit LAGE3 [Cavia porcellus]
MWRQLLQKLCPSVVDQAKGLRRAAKACSRDNPRAWLRMPTRDGFVTGAGPREPKESNSWRAGRSEGGATTDMLAAGAGMAVSAASGAGYAAPALTNLGSGQDPVPDTSGPNSTPHTFALSVPFPTPLDAEIALGSLAPDAEPQPGVIGKELTASVSTLAIRWTAQDVRLLRVSVLSFLEQLSLVVQTMQRFGPPVSR